MLIQFNFANYKSFRDDTSLNMMATKQSELQNQVAELGNNRLLKVAAIYGANASGKSNIYSAFDYMTYYVISSWGFGGASKARKGDKDDIMEVSPFLFDPVNASEPSTFEVFFVDNADKMERTYQYGFALQNKEVVEEWLYYKAKSQREYKTIFYRKKGQKTDYNGIGKISANIEMSLEKEALIVSLGAKLKIDKLSFVRDWFLKNEIVDFGDPLENYFRSNMLPDDFTNSVEVQNKVVEYFSSFDESIKKFDVEVKEGEDDDGEKSKSIRIDALHRASDGSYVPIPLKLESSGTLKMFALFPPIESVMENGGTLFVDELNARLHPLLTRNIILAFLNPEINKRHAQLIFTTHDVWQIENGFLRRDSIYLVNKEIETGASELYSLADYQEDDGTKIRKDASLVKHYLLGEYGAIPELKPFSVLGRND